METLLFVVQKWSQSLVPVLERNVSRVKEEILNQVVVRVYYLLQHSSALERKIFVEFINGCHTERPDESICKCITQILLLVFSLLEGLVPEAD